MRTSTGAEIDAPTSFFLGVAVNPAADDLDYELEALRAEARGGRELRDDPGPLRHRVPRPVRRATRRHVPRSRCSSASSTCARYQLALRLHNEVPGIVIPEHVQERLRDAGNAANEVGLELGEGAPGESPASGRPASTSSRRFASRSRRSTSSAESAASASALGRERLRPYLLEHVPYDRRRNPVTAHFPGRRANTVVSTRPPRVDRRAAGEPGAHGASDRGHGSDDRARVHRHPGSALFPFLRAGRASGSGGRSPGSRRGRPRFRAPGRQAPAGGRGDPSRAAPQDLRPRRMRRPSRRTPHRHACRREASVCRPRHGRW